MDRSSRYEKIVDNRLKETRLARVLEYEEIKEPVVTKAAKGKKEKPTSKSARRKSKDEQGKQPRRRESKSKERADREMRDEERDRRRGKIKKFGKRDSLISDEEIAEVTPIYFDIIKKVSLHTLVFFFLFWWARGKRER